VGELIPDHDDRPMARRDMRVSDDERRAVVEELRIHYGAGRLDLAEFEDRTNGALAARVRGQLDPLLDDLPELADPLDDRPAGAGLPMHPMAALRIHTYIWLVLSAFFLTLWAGVEIITTTTTPFWPIFPIAAIGLSVGIHAAVRRGLDT
jgi:hypothetical protein